TGAHANKTIPKERSAASGIPIRQANNLAFQTAVVGFFQTLSSWDQNSRLTLQLGLRGYRRSEKAAPEPNTYYAEYAGSHICTYLNGEEKSVPPYRAQFIGEDLANILCINKLVFLNGPQGHHRMWAGVAQTVVEHCPALTELYLDFDEWVRSDFWLYMRARRDGKHHSLSFLYISYTAISSLIRAITRSLQTFTYIGDCERPWKDWMPVPNVIPFSIDILTINLRDLSTCLRGFKLGCVILSLDFMWPLNDDGHPTPERASLWWPHLETWEACSMPSWSPSDADEQAEIDNIGDWDLGICHGKLDIKRSIQDEDHFHRLLISLGYAAQRMPRLEYMEFEMVFKAELDYVFTLEFFNDNDGAILTWDCEFGYRPDSRVARAWGFCLDDLDIDSPHNGVYSVMPPRWPPNQPIYLRSWTCICQLMDF
ncbi:hypothetical protein N7463_001141, partial [Penicillium fimorum]